jgi:hypothetical protein
METTTQQPAQKQTIDVTGLSAEAVQAVEVLVSQLKGQQQADQQDAIGSLPSYEAWSKALREWVDSHPRRDTLADDSRESIYADDRDE